MKDKKHKKSKKKKKGKNKELLPGEKLFSVTEVLPGPVQLITEPATSNQQPAIAEPPADKPATENMETHAHHLHKAPGKKWTHYLFEFLMLFIAVFAGFLAENQREHFVEKHRAHQFLQSMLLDVQDNMKHLDSLMHEDHVLMANHDSLVNWLLADSATIDRAAFSRTMGAVWMKNFLVRNETYEQMKSSGSLRYVGDIKFLREMMDYEIKTNFAQYRNQEFERKYYTELFIPALYKAYDLPCQINLDTSNQSDPFKMEKVAHHHDVLSGSDAAIFRHDMGAALTLRLERVKRSLDAFRDAKAACVEMERLIREKI
jgi:hypothetical protein